MNCQYNVGDTVFQNWTLMRLIGTGSCGKVYEAKKKDIDVENYAAVKIISVPQSSYEVGEFTSGRLPEKSAVDHLQSIVENYSKDLARILEVDDGSRFVRVEDYAIIPHPDDIGWDILILMELLPSFSTVLKTEQLIKADIVRLGIDICQALELCWQNNIIYCNIKPENIFRSETGHYKLGDVGTAHFLERSRIICALEKSTYYYMAPEIYQKNTYDITADVYSLGIMIYRLLNNNRFPFFPEYPNSVHRADREAALARRMGGDTLPYPANDHGRLADIVLRACAFDPKERYATPYKMRVDLEALLGGTEFTDTAGGDNVISESADEIQPESFDESSKNKKTEGSDVCPATEISSQLPEQPKQGKKAEPDQSENTVEKKKDDLKAGRKKKILVLLLALVILAAGGFGFYKVRGGRQAETALVIQKPDPIFSQVSTPPVLSSPITAPEETTLTPDGTPTPMPLHESALDMNPEPESTSTPEPTRVSNAILDSVSVSASLPTPHIHQWTAGTCTESKKCTLCGATEGVPLGHTEVIDTAKAPSCTEYGLTEGKHCSVCGEILVPQERIDPLGHEWAEATCTEPSTCTCCGGTTGKPLGHTEVIDAAVEPTCTESGLTEGKHCFVCGEVLVPQERIDPLGHKWTESTCTEPSTCTRCGATRGKAAGHSWARPTCAEPKICTVCGITEGEPLGHDWLEATVDSPKTCTRCGETEGEPLKAFIPTKLAVGEIITFGFYEQDYSSENGKEPIDWQVLDVQEDKALLISRCILARRPFEIKQDSATWESCSLRTWLNRDFYNDAFSPAEKAVILYDSVIAEDNPKYGTSSGSNTIDNVFLLSLSEAESYFTSLQERICLLSETVKGSSASDSCWWWLRTAGNSQKNVAVINYQGAILNGGDSCHKTDGGVRPAVWVKVGER